MTIKTRKLLLISSILAFLIITPFIIFYALGFNFDFKKKEIVTTGGLYLKVTPKEVKVFINNELKAENSLYTFGNDLFIKNLPETENFHNLEVRKDGYYTWKKEIAIKSSLVTEFKSILLLKKKPDLKLTKLKNIDEIEGNSKIKNLERFLGIGIKKFSIENNDVFFISDNKKLYKFDDSSSKSSVLLTDIIAFTKNYNSLYFIDDKGVLLTKEIDGTESRRLADFGTLFNNQEAIDMKAVNGVVMIKYKNDLFLLNSEKSQIEKIAENITDFKFDNQGKKILYSKESTFKNLNLKEIWVYYLESRIQPLIDAREASLIYSTSSKIENPSFVGPDEEQIIFSKPEDGISVIDIDLRGGQNSVLWIEVKNTKINYQGKTLLFEDKDKVFSVELY